MKTAVAIRHVAFEDVGTLKPVLDEAGYGLTYLEGGIDDLAPAETCDLLIVLGAPIGAYEIEAYPFLIPELDLIRRRLAVDRPTLGLCLGAQLMAQALGARVYPGPAKEIGWAPLSFVSEALRDLQGVAVLHWHGDTFDLPAGAKRLASTALTPNQAFSVGRNILALQFHAEAEARMFERWLIGHACEIGAAGLSPITLRADARTYAAGLEAAGLALFRRWIGNLG
jgi:GMP synthase (glutamine-hydrolysing)